MDPTGVVVAEGAEHPLRHALSIGRDPENDIVLAKSTVSRHHAVLTFVDDRWLVEDRGSANGTFVNGERVPFGSAHPLRHGDRIGVGAASLVFSWPAQGDDPDRTDEHEPLPPSAAPLSPFQLPGRARALRGLGQRRARSTRCRRTSRSPPRSARRTPRNRSRRRSAGSTRRPGSPTCLPTRSAARSAGSLGPRAGCSRVGVTPVTVWVTAVFASPRRGTVTRREDPQADPGTDPAVGSAASTSTATCTPSSRRTSASAALSRSVSSTQHATAGSEPPRRQSATRPS